MKDEGGARKAPRPQPFADTHRPWISNEPPPGTRQTSMPASGPSGPRRDERGRTWADDDRALAEDEGEDEGKGEGRGRNRDERAARPGQEGAGQARAGGRGPGQGRNTRARPGTGARKPGWGQEHAGQAGAGTRARRVRPNAHKSDRAREVNRQTPKPSPHGQTHAPSEGVHMTTAAGFGRRSSDCRPFQPAPLVSDVPPGAASTGPRAGR
jgi:hypothetical protein